MGAMRNVFMDTSALFSGIWSESGGARLILRLGEAGVLQVVLSQQVLVELDAVLRRKAPHLLPGLARLLDRVGVVIAEPGSAEQFETCLKMTGQPGDARILADAWQAGVDYLVSLNQKHILNHPELMATLPFGIGTPGDFVQQFRISLEGYRKGS